MYEESADYWNQTRTKKYKSTGTANWPVVQKLLDKLLPGDSVLDVGCGNGRLISGLSDDVKYTGIDFSRNLLAEAEKNFPHYDFRYGNIVEEYAWSGLSDYDATFCIAVLHHIPERDQQIYVLKKMREFTRSGGFLCLTVWNLWQERFLQYHLDSLHLKEINPRWVEVPFANRWKRFCVQMDIPYLMDLLNESGWSVEEIFYADSKGEKADIQQGENLVVIAR